MPLEVVSDYRAELKKAIAAMHGATPLWLATVPVKEVFRGQTAWEGEVEVFSLHGHAKASQCFAWGVRRSDDKGWDVTAVLAIPPVVTPELAVKAAIAARARQATARRS